MSLQKRTLSIVLGGLLAAVSGCGAEAGDDAAAASQAPSPGAGESAAAGAAGAAEADSVSEQRAAYEEHAALLEQALAELPDTQEHAELRAQLEGQLEGVRALLSSNAERGEGSIATADQALTGGDGCSAPWYADVFLGAVFLHPTQVFDGQCQYHDRCYTSGLATYNTSRLTCDDAWKSKLHARCESLYPAWRIVLMPHLAVLRAQCRATADLMYTAVRKYGEDQFWSTVCIDGQKWPTSGQGPGCSSYETFDSSRQRVCNGVAGMRSDGTFAGNWAGCRGSGCTACTELTAEYPLYFRNNPYCSPNDNCAGSHFTCGAACPEPDDDDRHICQGRCGGPSAAGCYCDAACAQYGDCCQDNSGARGSDPAFRNLVCQ